MESIIVWGVLLLIFSVLILAPCLVNKKLFKKMLTFVIFFGYIYAILLISFIFNLKFLPLQTTIEALVISVLYFGLVDNWIERLKTGKHKDS